MRLVGLAEAHRVEGGATPYSATDWLRRAVGPLVAAAAWERRHLPDSAPPIGRLDIEAAFLLAVPLVELPAGTTGRCRLAVEARRGGGPAFAGVLVSIEDGGIASCVPSLRGKADCWVSGSPRAWQRHLDSDPTAGLKVGGDVNLAKVVVEGLRRSLKKLH